MQFGNKTLILSFLFILFYNSFSITEDKILSTPLINLEKLKPSFEESNDIINDSSNNKLIQNKKKILKENNQVNAKFLGLDKITAKTSEIIVNLGEVKKFGPLEIKVLKCGKVDSENTAFNLIVGFIGIAQRRGAFALDEAAKIFECIEKFKKSDQ